jgi:hypothetical protein
MKKILYNLSVICLLMVGFVSIAQAKEVTTKKVAFGGNRQEFSKIIYKEFNISPFGTTQLSNKYGKIDVHTWDGEQVKIKVNIVTNTNSQAEAEKIFNRIRIDFYNDANFVKAATNILDESSAWSNWGWNSNRNSDYTINYEVYYPRGNFLDLSNRYGDNYIGTTNGAVKVNVKYGNVRTEDINNNLDLSLQYGDAFVANVKKEVTADIDYGKLIMKSAEKIKISGDYSEFELENANDVNLNSDYATLRANKIGALSSKMDYGHIKIKEVGNLTFDGDYTDITVNYLTNFVSVDMNYGGFSVDKVGKNFSECRIDANYTDVKIGTEDGCAYRLDAESNYGSINYPAGMNITSEKESNNSERVAGSMGSKTAKGFMKVSVNYGGIKIR